MNFTVVWDTQAEAELTVVWLAASDRNAVTRAAYAIEQRLQFNPANVRETTRCSLQGGRGADGTGGSCLDLPLRRVAVQKAYTTRMPYGCAVDLAGMSNNAHADGRVDDEVRYSITTHALCAMAAEGVANEVGEAIAPEWFWELLERTEPVKKWSGLSELIQKEVFRTGAEPLQTVKELVSKQPNCSSKRI